MKTLSLAILATLLAGPVLAESHEMAAPTGDAAAGQQVFDRQCVSCHVVQNAEGEVLAGRSAKTGPNLWGVAGATPGVVDGFNYGDAIVAYGETGAVWNEETFTAYVQNPTDFLRTALDDRRARGKMSYQVRSADDAANVYAYLATFGPDADAAN